MLALASGSPELLLQRGICLRKSATARSLVSFLITIYFCAVVLADTIIPAA
jgi:hypothetical protein